MIDPLATGLEAVRSASPATVAAVFAAGLLTSVGPCVAPRYIAIAALVNGYRKPLVPTLVFVTGMLVAFMTLGFGAGALGAITTSASLVYALLAAGLILSGFYVLVQAVPAADGPATCCTIPIDEPARSLVRRSLGGVFLMGAASALVISPCCTPVVGTIAATSAAIGKPLVGAALLACFTIGHAAPLIVAGGMTTRLRRFDRLRPGRQAAAIVSGVLMLALGGYYGLLA